MDWFLYDRDLRHEELTKLDNKFTESHNQKILISCVFMCASNGWKNHSGQICSTNTETGDSRCSVKMAFLTVSQSIQESIFVGVSY